MEWEIECDKCKHVFDGESWDVEKREEGLVWIVKCPNPKCGCEIQVQRIRQDNDGQEEQTIER